MVNTHVVALCPREEMASGQTKIRVSIYFDGTGNNRENVSAYENKKTKEDIDGRLFSSKRYSSYRGDYTNVARLFNNFVNHSEIDVSLSIYVEGIGTESPKKGDGKTEYQPDDLQGYGTGKGSTGIYEKVTRTIQTVVDDIFQKINESEPDIEFVHIDVFGFSRGAAAARHFIHRIFRVPGETLQEQLARRALRVGSVLIKFAGLFDTVSSYGMPWNFDNDTEELGLDAITLADAPVHLVAAEEYRENFSLTDIRSAPHGREIYLPGAHADIGGGYTKDEKEDDWLLYFIGSADRGDYIYRSPAEKKALERERKWFEEAGWYASVSVSEFGGTIYGSRTIGNQYSFLPLFLMREFAAQNGAQHEAQDQMEVNFEIPEELQWLWNKIRPLAFSSSRNSASDWRDSRTEEMRTLRRNYLHFSARYEFGNYPNWSKDGPIRGHRERDIYAG